MSYEKFLEDFIAKSGWEEKRAQEHCQRILKAGKEMLMDELDGLKKLVDEKEEQIKQLFEEMNAKDELINKMNENTDCYEESIEKLESIIGVKEEQIVNLKEGNEILEDMVKNSNIFDDTEVELNKLKEEVTKTATSLVEIRQALYDLSNMTIGEYILFENPLKKEDD